MQNMILVLHLLICVVLVGAVLMQRSEGGALGMGGGGTGGLISGRGAADMMVNITSWVGGAFFVTSVFLAVLASSRPADRSVIPVNGEKAGFHFSIPGLPKAAPKAAAPAPVTPATTPASTSGLPDGVLAPAPVEALTRAGPLSAQPVGAAPVGAAPVGAVRTAPPAAGLPTAAAPATAAPRTAAPVGAAPKATPPATTPAAAQKTTAPAPMIPLPAATPPAPTTESAQAPVPAPADRQKAGPDE